MKIVTLKEAKSEAEKGLKQAIAVSIKKFEAFLPLTVQDVRHKRLFGVGNTCGLCWHDKIFGDDACGSCLLAIAGDLCFDEGATYRRWLNANISIRTGTETVITGFRKETRKMIKVLKKLYKDEN